MAEKEIETVKKSEEKALNIIANAKKEADTIIKSAKAQQETTHKQELSKYKEEMKAANILPFFPIGFILLILAKFYLGC